MHEPALTKAQQRRLEKLAREAGRTPQAMLRFVLRDGFELCEEDVAAARSAEVELARSGTVPHRQVSNEARDVIAHHARAPRRQAA
jgi:predicted transcriptional regulator